MGLGCRRSIKEQEQNELYSASGYSFCTCVAKCIRNDTFDVSLLNIICLYMLLENSLGTRSRCFSVNEMQAMLASAPFMFILSRFVIENRGNGKRRRNRHS
jgi:hypothetical protein